jgi:hypothetical protein
MEKGMQVYLTNYNLMRLFEEDKEYADNWKRFPKLYEAFKLLTRADQTRLGTLDAYLSSDSDAISNFKLKKRQYNDSGSQSDDMVFQTKKPAYHQNPKCERLHSDYENFKIPEIIKERGEANEYKIWFRANMDLYKSDFPAFEFRLKAKFGFDVSVERVNFDNSGSVEMNLDTIESLEAKIEYHLFNAKYEMDRNDMNRAIFEQHRFDYGKAYIVESGVFENRTPYREDEVREVLKNYNRIYIVPLKKMIIDYMILLENRDASIDMMVHNLHDFTPCRYCCS